jgi:hypothetical protein
VLASPINKNILVVRLGRKLKKNWRPSPSPERWWQFFRMSKNVDDTKTFADKYFDFLVSDFGFVKTSEHYVSYECHFGYQKNKIEINFCCEADGTSLPWVTLRDHRDLRRIGNTNYPASYHLTQIEVPEKMKEIFPIRTSRRNPKVEKFIQTFDHTKNNYNETHKELDDDYELNGRNEIEIIVKEYSGIIKRHPEILNGDLSIFPKEGKTKSVIYETISLRQPNGKMKIEVQNRKMKTSGIWNWLKSLFQ